MRCSLYGPRAPLSRKDTAMGIMIEKLEAERYKLLHLQAGYKMAGEQEAARAAHNAACTLKQSIDAIRELARASHTAF